MGVPKFFRWISERYRCVSETVKEFQIPEFDNVYLDMNDIFHVCSHPEDDNPHFRITEEQIFSDIMNYLEFLFRMIKPRKVFFMAVDGVAPRAKMNQQRRRRFRSAREAEKLEKMAKEKGETLPTEKRFDSNCITPGTPFMVRLQEQLKYFVVKKLSTDPLWHGVRVYLSGHETPGEGEHKIMDFIRHERSQPGYDANTRHCFYGLDADLMISKSANCICGYKWLCIVLPGVRKIRFLLRLKVVIEMMLGLATHEPHISLLREEVRFERGGSDQHKTPSTAEETTFHLLHLSLFREYLDIEFSALRETIPFSYDLENVIDDWVLVSVLVGNDFIPHLPNLHIKLDALPLLWSTYIDVLPSCGGYLNEGGHLNLERFEKYIAALSKFDIDTFSEKEVKISHRVEVLSAVRKFFENVAAETQSLDGQCQLTSQGQLSPPEPTQSPQALSLPSTPQAQPSTPTFNIDNDFAVSTEDEESSITVADRFIQHKRSYYMTKMEYQEVTPEVLKDQAEGYIRGIQWILLYYYEGVPSWSWFYPHHYAPYISDVKDFKNMKLQYDLGTPFMQFEQLMAVLPSASKELLPEPYQALMTLDSSPVIDFYPVKFDTDLNGKEQAWEAVVLIPFIDENRLLTAMKTKEDNLMPEEAAMNCHGPCLLYEYSPEPLGVYHSSLPGAFPDIPVNHSKITKIPKDGLILPSKLLKKGLLPDTKVDVYYAGFPTFKHIPFQSQLSPNVMLTIDNQVKPDIQRIAKDYLGQEILVGWPHLYEAKVVTICDDEKCYSLGESNQPQTTQLKEEDNDENAWFPETLSIKKKYRNRLGVNIGDIDIIVKALPMTGKKYVFGSDGRVTLEKQFGNRPVSFALQATVKDIAVHDSSYCQFKTLKEYLPEASSVFMLGWPHYGCQGEVIEVDQESGCVRINLSIFEEPRLSSIINNPKFGESYSPGYILAQQLRINSFIVSRITGTILVTAGEKELVEQQQYPHSVNIGLNLKFTRRGEEVPGYTKMHDGKWTYSQKVTDILQEYIQKFPEMFDSVSWANNDMFDFSESQLIPRTCDYTLQTVQEYIKSLPCSNIKPVKCGADYISEGTIAALEEEAKRVVALNKKKVQPNESIQVKQQLLFRHVSSGGAVIPDSTTDYQLYDRVVNIRQGYPVPFGLRGTVVGIHPADVEVNTVYEVIFDEEFMGGISISNSSNRVYKMPPFSLLNLTYGERKNGVIHVHPPKDLNQQNNSNQFNRNLTGNHKYSEATTGGSGSNYQSRHQSIYDGRNSSGFGGYKDNCGGQRDNQGASWRGQEEGDRYARNTSQDNNNKPQKGQ